MVDDLPRTTFKPIEVRHPPIDSDLATAEIRRSELLSDFEGDITHDPDDLIVDLGEQRQKRGRLTHLALSGPAAEGAVRQHAEEPEAGA